MDMESLTFAIVNSSNIVENVVLWDGVTEWSPCHEDDQLVLILDGVSVQAGDIHNEDDTFSRPTPPEVIE
jgi:hypothetical protein